MKKLITITGAVLCAAVININAAGFLSLAPSVADAGNLTLTLSPAYAPNVKDAAGDTSPWGIGASATYSFTGEMSQFMFTGVRVDYLGGDFWAPSITGGLKADVKFMDAITVTPLAYTGVVFPLNEWKEQAGSGSGTIAGAGFTVHLWRTQWKGVDMSLKAGGAAERWFMNDAAERFDGTVYRGFLAVTFKKAAVTP